MAAKAGSVAGNSAPIVVKVYHWSYLSDQYTRPFAGDLMTDPNTAHGVSYDHVITMDAGCYNAWNGDAWVDYILNKRYQLLHRDRGPRRRRTAELDRDVERLGRREGARLGKPANGAVNQVKVSVANMYRLRLKINVPDPTGAAGCSSNFTQVVFGNPEILGP